VLCYYWLIKCSNSVSGNSKFIAVCVGNCFFTLLLCFCALLQQSLLLFLTLRLHFFADNDRLVFANFNVPINKANLLMLYCIE